MNAVADYIQAVIDELKHAGVEYEADVYGDDKPMLVGITLLGSVLDNFVAGKSMIAWKDGKPVLVEVV